MGKRKRGQDSTGPENALNGPQTKKSTISNGVALQNGDSKPQDSISLQIITGSYDRVLHGIIATVSTKESTESKVQFQDNFLFNAHASAIRCLALSPLGSKEQTDNGKIMLATGGTDERINLYSLSTSLPSGPSLPSLSSVPSLENPKNKELGLLLHHTSTVNALHFPSKAKLISASDDNTISISRTKDWTVLSTVKAPMPKVQGRPSGDTAPLGVAPAGINDFAVHPSMKLMISVGKGEKCMRLWNLVTGKKANVLNFEKELLQAVGESKWSRGEGQKVAWNLAGDEFAIAFERGVAVFGMDSEVKCVAVPQPASKVHHISYLSTTSGSSDILAVSTEDGRLLFYSTELEDTPASTKIPAATLKSYLGGKEAGVKGRIKDFHIADPSETEDQNSRIVVTVGSDGAVMIWRITGNELIMALGPTKPKVNGAVNGTTPKDNSKDGPTIPKIGSLLGQYSTTNRITCMKAFPLHGYSEEEEDEGLEYSSTSEQASSEEDSVIEGGEEFAGFE